MAILKYLKDVWAQLPALRTILLLSAAVSFVIGSFAEDSSWPLGTLILLVFSGAVALNDIAGSLQKRPTNLTYTFNTSSSTGNNITWSERG